VTSPSRFRSLRTLPTSSVGRLDRALAFGAHSGFFCLTSCTQTCCCAAQVQSYYPFFPLLSSSFVYLFTYSCSAACASMSCPRTFVSAPSLEEGDNELRYRVLLWNRCTFDIGLISSRLSCNAVYCTASLPHIWGYGLAARCRSSCGSSSSLPIFLR